MSKKNISLLEKKIDIYPYFGNRIIINQEYGYMSMNDKIKIRKMTKSFYAPVALIEELEEITRPMKGMNVNKVVNEGLELWLKQFKDEGVRK